MSGIMLTIGDLFIIGVLMIIYYNKEQFSQIRNRLYRYMLIVLIVLLVTEIMATAFVVNGYASIFTDIMFRLHWSTGIIIFSLLYYYTKCFLDNLEAPNLVALIKSDKLFIRRTIFFVIALIVFFFVPFSDIRTENVNYIPGPAAYYILVFCFIVVMLLVRFTYKNRSRVPKYKKISVAFMIIELFATFAFQIAFINIAIIATAMSIQMFFLYFIIENPDLEVIAALEETKKEIEASSKAKSDFLSNMSHEIRTPMNAIIGFSDSILTRKRFSKKETIQDINNISTASHNLLDIINNILDISKIESGKEVLIEREYSLKKMVNDLQDITKQRIGTSNISFELEIDSSIPDRLYGDYTKLYQVLLNLLSNAVKYTEVGKIILTVAGDVSTKEVKLRFEVKDSGYGIKEEDYSKVFGKFNRLSNATNNEIEGSGLGLVITKEYVELMGGKIGFDSTYGVGSTFYVDVTQKISGKEKVGVIEKNNSVETTTTFLDCSNYKVLIVDDNALNIKVAEKLLSRYNFQIESCPSGEECIYKVKSGNKYDLIFMDHMMPDMDGIETLHILEKLDMFEIPPVVALTANAISGMREMYLKEGFADYISKPINIRELDRVVNKYFKR